MAPLCAQQTSHDAAGLLAAGPLISNPVYTRVAATLAETAGPCPVSAQVSHSVLRLAHRHGPELRRWFLAQEAELFAPRFRVVAPDELGMHRLRPAVLSKGMFATQTHLDASNPCSISGCSTRA